MIIFIHHWQQYMARIYPGDYDVGLCFEHDILDCSALMVKNESLTCALSTNSRLSQRFTRRRWAVGQWREKVYL